MSADMKTALELPTPELTFHPLAEIFPLMEGAEFDALVEDIKQNGLREPITEYRSQVLDGRNRFRACKAVGVKIRTKQFKGDDPVAFVLSANLQRRHLNESQRAMVAIDLANMKVGGDTRSEHSVALRKAGISQSDAARMVGVSTRLVTSAGAVRDRAIPELVDRVRRGELAVTVLEKVAKAIEREDQQKLVNATEAELRGAAKSHRRAQRTEQLAASTKRAAEELGEKLYSVIYADPPWRFEPYSRDTGMDRAADNHYPTEQIDAIKAMSVPSAENAVLFLWATAPLLPEALEVMRAWGFTYRSNCIWAKPHAGTGYWFRSQHEQLLVGTKGNIPAPAPGEQYSSLIEAQLAEHSVKPNSFAEMIEEMFPGVPALEMFAREARLGWDVWGNEAPLAEAAE